MRPLFCALFVCGLAAPALAQQTRSLPADQSAQSEPGEFALGGAAIKPALIVETPKEPTPARRALTLPLSATETGRHETDLIPGITLYAAEVWDAGRDTFELGTAYTQGGATAGVSVTYLEEREELTRSELYVDFAFSQNLTVGVSGILESEFAAPESEVSPQFGVSAAYETQGGALFEGGIAGAPEQEPVFGLSVGLRF